MKFGNVALYCKGWYAYRDGTCKNMWMDMIHCINADGWCIWNKNDVVFWCMHRMDEMRNDPNFPYKNQLDLSYFYNEVNEILRRDSWYYHEGLDFEDAIILHFRNIISNIEMKYFNEKLVKPNENVLPLHYNHAYYSEVKYNSDNKPSYTFAEMRCDVMKRIEERFKDCEDQKIAPDEFEKTEGWIRGKKWEDVTVICGTDSLLDCEEISLTGNFLNNTHNKYYKDEDFLDLNIYDHTINFDDNKQYLCRVKKEVNHWEFGDDVNYKLMSVLKEI